MKAFRVMGRTLKATWEELFLCVYASIVWWAGTLVLIFAGPVTLGLHAVANRAANYRRTSMEFFWESARGRAGRAWLAYGVLIALFVGILGNVYFYLSVLGSHGWAQVAALLWLWVLLLYLVVAQYVFPLLCQQDKPDLLTALRNAALLALRSPVYSVLMLLFHVALIAASITLVLPIILLMPAMLALAGNFALTGLLQEMGLAPQPPQPGGGER
jgi:hypothetical protein